MSHQFSTLPRTMNPEYASNSTEDRVEKAVDLYIRTALQEHRSLREEEFQSIKRASFHNLNQVEAVLRRRYQRVIASERRREEQVQEDEAFSHTLSVMDKVRSSLRKFGFLSAKNNDATPVTAEPPARRPLYTEIRYHLEDILRWVQEQKSAAKR